MGARQHPATDLGVIAQPVGIEGFDHRLDLGIAQLSHVVVLAFRNWDPSQEHVRSRLDQTLPGNEEDALLRAERFLKLGFVVYAINDPKGAVFMNEAQISEHFAARAPAATRLGRRSQPEARGEGAAPAGNGGAAQIGAGGKAETTDDESHS